MNIPEKNCSVCGCKFFNSRLDKKGHRIRKYTKEKWGLAKYCSHKCYWSDVVNRQSNRKGTGVSLNYSAIHKWVTTEKGFARDNSCSFCGNQAKEWANIDSKYKRKKEDYIPLCFSCHRKYDKARCT